MPQRAKAFTFIFCLLSLLAQIFFVAPVLSKTLPNNSDESSNLKPLPLNENDLLVVQASYGSFLLAESLFVFKTPETTLIPVQGFFEALDFPIEVDLDAQTLDGWFISEDAHFSLDIYNQSVFVKGIRQAWPKHFQYAEDGFDLYIDLHSLEQWFDLTLSLDVSQLSLDIKSLNSLPVVLQKQRQMKQAKIDQQTLTAKKLSYLPNEYDYLGDPSLDIELNYDLENNQGSSNQFSGAVLQGTMDFLKHSMRTSFVNQGGEADLRVTFSRAAKGPDQSMMLGVDEYEIGDIFSHTDTLLFGSANGSGFHIKRGKSALLDQSTDILIEGDAPPGWEVELYRNGALIDFASPSSKGQYQFDNIATFSGENIFDIRIYGPQGQYKIRQKRITVGANMIPENSWEYQVYGFKRNKSLLNSNLNNNDATSNFFLAEASYGLNEYLTFQTGINQMSPEGTTSADTSFTNASPTNTSTTNTTTSTKNNSRNYQFLSLFASLDGSLAQVKLAYDAESGNAIASSLKGRWFDTNFNIDILKFNHLISERSSNGQLKLDAKIRANGLLPKIKGHSVSYDFEIRHIEQRLRDQKQLLLSNRLSTRWRATQITHNLRFSHSAVDGAIDTLDATLSATKKILQWRVKTEINYGLEPTAKFQGIGSSASYQSSKKFAYQALIDYQKSDTESLSISNILTWSFHPAALSLSVGFNNNDRQFVGLSLTTSLAYDRKKQSFELDKNGYSSSARIRAHAFIDTNNNGFFDAKDSPLEGITFKGRNAWKNTPTDSNGYATLKGVPVKSLQPISIEEGSIEDPFMKIKAPQRYLYTHAGKLTELSFQLVPTVEIEGEINFLRNDKKYKGTNIPLALYSEQNELIAETTSEYDGVFIFENILPGKYHLVVDNTYLERHQFAPYAERYFNIQGDEGVIYSDSITLQNILSPTL